jgi:hypothetical protein
LMILLFLAVMVCGWNGRGYYLSFPLFILLSVTYSLYFYCIIGIRTVYLGIQLIQWWCIAFVDGDTTQFCSDVMMTDISLFIDDMFGVSVCVFIHDLLELIRIIHSWIVCH